MPGAEDVAIWQQILDALQHDLACGHYAPGDKLPTEAALSARFSVNRHTVRRALGALSDQGLVHARRGAGVFVTAQPTAYRISRRTRFHQNLSDAGQTPTKDVLRLETRAADGREAQALHLPPGAQVHVWEGVSLADGVPLSVFRSVFCAARFPALLKALAATRSVTLALEHCGLCDYVRASTRLSAERATAERARLLRLPRDAPLLRSVAVNTDLAGTPVEYGRTWFAGDRVQLLIDGDAGAP
ncbi:phosphonate metabolism transcriptional regulator PhnF [Roseicitreum antarcticum]|uniref:phosphonate metabolism transcriptional regulator PhnF n=1 Tax=Roseicitreum antarcticum TaxID=564137 RepID=UPI001CC1E58D|nr:phosphonate metabolism transcriptional regulator PhnF [Roseicitreum antarcticum]